MEAKSEFLRRYTHACGSYLALLDKASPYKPFYELVGLEHSVWHIYEEILTEEPKNKPIADFVTEVVREYKSNGITLEQALHRLDEVEYIRGKAEKGEA